ncbi:hypothetical protein JNUCC0626_47420 [Lentzea sp. JNUCC 0626]|uniref:hypothetical protein n=1 Tax=Lentzea sp. JNUCC 0626 TaxID=3367513 RepID=UPI0037491C11
MRKTVKAAVVLSTIGVLTTAVAAPASADNGAHYLALRTPTNVLSVFVSGTGWTTWTANGQSGSAGSPSAPIGLDACYMYTGDNSGNWARTRSGLQIYVNQGQGRQGIGDGFQHSNPRWSDGTKLRITLLSSRDCTTHALRKAERNVPADQLQWFWLQL